MNPTKLYSLLTLIAFCMLLSPFANAQKIALMPKGSKTNFWQIYIAGANKAAEELGIELTQRSPSIESDLDAQDKIFAFFVARGYDAIVLTPLDANRLVGPVEEAIANGITIVIADSGLRTDKAASFIASNNRRSGNLGAEGLSRQLGKDATGKVLNLRYLKGSASTDAREDGAFETLSAMVPKVTIINDVWGGVVLGDIKREVDATLAAHSDLVGIVTTNTLATVATLKSLKANGLTGKVAFWGSGVNEELLAGLAAGEISGLYVQNPYDMAYLAVKTAYAAANGQPVEKEIFTDVALLTKENMNDPEKQKLIKP